MSTNPEPRRKGGCLRIAGIALLAVLGFIILIAGCSAIFGGETTDTTPAEPIEEITAPTEPSPAPDPAPTPPTGDIVTLTANADGPATIIWGDLTGSTNSEEFTTTWTKELVAADDETYHMSVTIPFQSGTTTVTCTLAVNGEVVDEATGTGDIGSASCTQPLFG